ncbi:MAG TPA: hypothetical protein VJ942_01775, partial [Roseovarius sp.]|nr:hypothetical protein [Roseovarius sp.]
RPEPPETGQDLSGTAANAQSLIGKALGSHLERLFLRSQTLVFPQNRLKPGFRCISLERLLSGKGHSFANSPPCAQLLLTLQR